LRLLGVRWKVVDAARALASATGVLRSTVGKQTGIKFVPTLTFVADVVPDTARELDAAIERVKHADAELASLREGASYAGEPDPYRRPAEEDDEDAPDESGTPIGAETADEEAGDVPIRTRSAS
jgi:ribosome-binding factor A